MVQCKKEIMSNEVKTVATNFGFMPVLDGKRYFISYKSEDSERIGEITRKLNEMGVPMWYDYGIEKGERWNQQINQAIKSSEAFILFATKTLFSVEDTWVRKEFNIAKMYRKKKYVVWLDVINPYDNPDDVSDELKDWYLDVDDLQGIRMAGKTADHIAWSIATEFHLIKGMKPQPPLPTYRGVSQERSVSTSTIPPQPVLQTPLTSPPVSNLFVQVGSKMKFGQYPQGANGEVQPLVWRVLTLESGKALLITDKLIDIVRYNTGYVDITWENCSLRKWLNNDFINVAFNSDQQKEIATVINENDFISTSDKVFVLSVSEAKRYFLSDKDRIAYTTEYVHAKGHDSRDRTLFWWLRSSGNFGNRAVRVLDGGDIDRSGFSVNDNKVAIRPALWLVL